MASAFVSTSACVLALAGLSLVPAEARACSPDPCVDFEVLNGLFLINQDAVPTDGVFVLATSVVGSLSMADIVADLEFTVTQDGEPVAGALEDSGVPNVVLWRPDGPLTPFVVTTAIATFKNPQDAINEGCAFGDLEVEYDIHVASNPAVPLTKPEVTAQYTLEIYESRGLQDLACCDGAYPTEFECGITDVYWDSGQCASIRGTRYMNLVLGVDNLLPKPTAGLLATTYIIDGEELITGAGVINLFTLEDSPVCVVAQQTNLANGETVQSAELCVGEAEDGLGVVELDAAAQLAGLCTDPLYTCELAKDAYPNQWDPEQCTPFESAAESETSPTSSDGESESSGEGGESSDEGGEGGQDFPEKGCGCATDSSDVFSLFGLFVLGLVPRRRRQKV
jgi:MYXO-CTERM domain-containing protein